MELEGIMGSKISETKMTNTIWFHFFVESKNKKKRKETDVMYKMVTTVNNTALYIWKLPRE